MIENPLRWPNGARCAVAFTFDMDAESLLHIYQPETAHNRLALSSMLRYGPEVAVPRIVAAYAASACGRPSSSPAGASSSIPGPSS